MNREDKFSRLNAKANLQAVPKGRYGKDFIDSAVGNLSMRSGARKQNLICRLLLVGMVKDPIYGKYFKWLVQSWKNEKRVEAHERDNDDVVVANEKFLTDVLEELGLEMDGSPIASD